GVVALANGGASVRIYRASGNFIGTEGDGVADDQEGNVIAFSVSGSVLMVGDLAGSPTANNIVAGNRIGTTANGQGATDLGGLVDIDGAYAQSNRIGSNADGTSDDLERNVIYGLIVIANGANNNVVAGNYAGISADGR